MVDRVAARDRSSFLVSTVRHGVLLTNRKKCTTTPRFATNDDSFFLDPTRRGPSGRAPCLATTGVSEGPARNVRLVRILAPYRQQDFPEAHTRVVRCCLLRRDPPISTVLPPFVVTRSMINRSNLVIGTTETAGDGDTNKTDGNQACDRRMMTTLSTCFRTCRHRNVRQTVHGRKLWSSRSGSNRNDGTCPTAASVVSKKTTRVTGVTIQRRILAAIRVCWIKLKDRLKAFKNCSAT